MTVGSDLPDPPEDPLSFLPRKVPGESSSYLPLRARRTHLNPMQGEGAAVPEQALRVRGAWDEENRSEEPELCKVESDDDSDGGDPPSNYVPKPGYQRELYAYHAVVNTAVEVQLLQLCCSPCCLRVLASVPFQAAGIGERPATYREVYLQLTIPIEQVRVVLPGVPNIGYVYGEFQMTGTIDYAFLHQILEINAHRGASMQPMAPVDV